MPRDSIKGTKLGSAYTAQGLLPHSIQPVSFSLRYVTLSQSVQVMGPTIEDPYRVRENRPVRWKRLRVEKIESRRGHDFSFKIQAPIFLTIREYIVTGRRNN